MAHLEKALEQQLIKASKVIEEHVDAEIHRLDQLEEDDIEVLRKKRLAQMKHARQQQEEWRANGHGSYTEISDERDFFDTCKRSKNVVCHFHRESTFRCKIVDKHLSLLAQQHLECKFIKLNVEKAPFLTKRLNVRVIPTICLVKDEKTTDYIIGFDDLGGHDEFTTEMMEWRIAQSQCINYNGDLLVPPVQQQAQERKNLFGKDQKPKTIRGKTDDSSDEDDW